MANPSPDWAALPATSARREEILVTVKAYPNPSKKYIETVCVAGITRSGDWIRLYPIPFRFLAYEQQFPTYGWIEATVRKSKEHRPESHHVDVDSLQVKQIIDTANRWRVRREFLLPLVNPSIEYLREQNANYHTSLGMIRPKQVRKLIIKKESAEWSPQELAKLRQRSLLDAYREDGTLKTVQELEKIPYRFLYDFTCDDERCTGHKMSIISWEVLQTYRNFRRKYGDKWEGKFREKYELELPGPSRELHFYVGTVSTHPREWTIIGLFYPPAQQASQPVAIPSVIQPSLF